ncbi:pantoate/beta-alanine ligase [Chloroherpeton thalassium ATCC 35110]|uniref:Pantothenate synthetase n=1 Tax=Chloroherpeton thalassium (strain ATCC 35110 / GB-78) TaxID=517418 RepID=PANC_CHLT3|nr:pantoate--beta-alanine ligase [Chloroherpeton thalassium]B3QSB4.1 RecName: Full=Pantothenate synthetase; Short=PS; AltName: Full=Pantoate--beta-alanine ligase; AltName: Full=Pantoate-activating enzyme [Chloroherpeton thalassium ATCC 35110]ACF12505.1 pantoate/beta-alanine ligase [Chloroherpeton thalassium ATCC 35110]
MKIIETVSEMQHFSESLRIAEKRLGVVPTMGALHDGHLSLVKLALKHADVAIMTIFVNPLQFGPSEDFAKYPRTFERDAMLAEKAGVSCIFAPTPETLYPSGFQTHVTVDEITQGFEGELRPGHFRGVTTVVAKLFNITKPHVAVFGEKDAQQLAAIRKMQKDLNFDVEIVPAPIVRETDGLAKSSRNIYLNPAERKQAVVLNESLEIAKSAIQHGERNVKTLLEVLNRHIQSAPLAEPDYIAIVDAESFQPVQEELLAEETYLVLLTVRFGSTRLLDNCRIEL